MSLLQLILSKAEEGFEISFRSRDDKLTEVLVMRSGKHACQVFETHRTRINDDAGVAAYCINVCCGLIECNQEKESKP